MCLYPLTSIVPFCNQIALSLLTLYLLSSLYFYWRSVIFWQPAPIYAEGSSVVGGSLVCGVLVTSAGISSGTVNLPASVNFVESRHQISHPRNPRTNGTASQPRKRRLRARLNTVAKTPARTMPRMRPAVIPIKQPGCARLRPSNRFIIVILYLQQFGFIL